MKTRTLLPILFATICAPLMAAQAVPIAPNYLIVTNEDLKPGFEELKTFRESPEGDRYRVDILTVESLGLPATFGPPMVMQQSENDPVKHDDYAAVHMRAATIHAAIRPYLEALKAQHPGESLYVVLGGRANVIPPVQASPGDFPSSHPGADSRTTADKYTFATGIATDVFYAQLETPWTETPAHRFDPPLPAALQADAHVGRLPFENANQVRSYVKRMRRYLAKDDGLVPNSIFLHGTLFTTWNWSGTFPTRSGVTAGDGYPWLDDTDRHPRARAHNQLPNNRKVLDVELWLRNTFTEYIAPYTNPDNGKTWRLDLFFDKAAGDPQQRGHFTDRYSIDRPEDINAYLRESPELFLHAGHGLNRGMGKISVAVTATPGNRWGVIYTAACNTAVIDSYAIRGGENQENQNGQGRPSPSGSEGQWLPYAFGEHTLVSGGDTSGGLVYIGCTRQGWSMPNMNRVGDYSNRMSAEFAKRWAKEDTWTLGQSFTDHRRFFLEGRTSFDAYWRALLLGTIYLGDPALRPLRAARSNPALHTPFPLFLRNGETLPITQTVQMYAGQIPDTHLTPPSLPGKIFLGWTHNGAHFDSAAPLPYLPNGLTLTAVWRDAYPNESADRPTQVFTRVAYDGFDDVDPFPKSTSNQANANDRIPLIAGNALPLSKYVSMKSVYADVKGAQSILFVFRAYLRQEDALDDYNNDAVIAELSLSGSDILTLRRQGNRGYTWYRNGTALANTNIAPEYWVHLTVMLNRTDLGWDVHFLKDTLPFSTVPGPHILPLGRENLKFRLGGPVDGSTYKRVAGFQWTDEVAVFKGSRPATLGDIRLLAAQTTPIIPVHAVLNGEQAPDLSDPNTPMHLSGSGTLALKDGQTLPPLSVTPGSEIRITFPDGGHAKVTEATKKALGLEAFIWTPSPYAPFAADNHTWIGEAHLRVTALIPGKETLTAEAEVYNEKNTVHFAPNITAHTFRLQPMSPAGTPNGQPDVPMKAEINDTRASLAFPAADRPTRLFRIETVTP